jgi:hypothetical protein
MKSIYSIALLAAALSGLAACSSHEARQPVSDAPVASTKFNDAQEEQGTIERFLLTSRGDIDGMILTGGIQVSTPPHLSAQVRKTMAVNDTVLVKGFYQNDRVFKAEKITNVRTSKSVAEMLSPPPKPEQEELSNYLPPEGTRSAITKTPGPNHKGLKSLSAEGTVQNRIYGQMGELNGVVLSDGSIVHFKPDVINTMDINAQVGDRMKASGYGTENSLGRSIDATEVIRE